MVYFIIHSPFKAGCHSERSEESLIWAEERFLGPTFRCVESLLTFLGPALGMTPSRILLESSFSRALRPFYYKSRMASGQIDSRAVKFYDQTWLQKQPPPSKQSTAPIGVAL